MVAEQRGRNRLSGRQRAAGLLIALGPEVSGKVLARFKEHEVETLTWEITNMGQISADVRDELLEAAYGVAIAQDYVSSGGIDYAMEILEQAFGPEKARDIAKRVFDNVKAVPFAFARELDASQLVSFLGNEHPQTVALILSYVAADKAAAVLANLPVSIQADVAMRIARMERTAPEVVNEVEELMQRKLAAVLTSRSAAKQVGGTTALVKLLKSVDRTTERGIIETLEVNDPGLASEIKKQMFVFENILLLDDRSIQRVMRDLDMKDLALALKGASDEVKRRILKNMSERAAAMLEDDMSAMGPVRIRNVEEAQGRVVNIIRALDEAEEIVISREDDEVLD
ncbi:MAG: flagellar motor switch protein FliG [Chloroflexi bacterium]|nr:flagellar motor switch protein FliG [Chloroflexota bacterium]